LAVGLLNILHNSPTMISKMKTPSKIARVMMTSIGVRPDVSCRWDAVVVAGVAVLDEVLVEDVV
jgi:hypothetical protein